MSFCAAFLLLLVLHNASAQNQTTCTSYIPETCLTGNILGFKSKRCHPRQCAFSPGAISCPFPESGRFVTTSTNCTDPFMQIVVSNTNLDKVQNVNRTNLQQMCRSAASDLGPGKYAIGSRLETGATEYIYEPAQSTGCNYWQVNRMQFMDALERTGNRTLVVFGDSMMRQLTERLIGMIRGQQRLFDPRIPTHSQYLFCDHADAFRLSQDNSTGGDASGFNATYLQTTIEGFFNMRKGPGLQIAKRTLSRCSASNNSAVYRIHYLPSQHFDEQQQMMATYFSTVNNNTMDRIKPVVVAYVGFWSHNKTVPVTYLAELLSLKDKASTIFVINIPTGNRAPGTNTDNFLARNKLMQSFVAINGPPFVYVDYDGLTRVPDPKPPTPATTSDLHLMCSLWWQTVHVNGTVNAKYQIPDGSIVSRVEVTADTNCADETNRNLWQIMFNTLR